MCILVNFLNKSELQNFNLKCYILGGKICHHILSKKNNNKKL